MACCATDKDVKKKEEGRRKKAEGRRRVWGKGSAWLEVGMGMRGSNKERDVVGEMRREGRLGSLVVCVGFRL